MVKNREIKKKEREIKKDKKTSIILPFLVIFYLFLRFVNLTTLPIFNDEAIYLNWGWGSIHNPEFLYVSLHDAKQPLLIWIFGFAETMFKDPLFAGRSVSVLTGLITLIGIYFLSKHISNRFVAYIACLLYCLHPLFSLYDRQALMESSIAACGIWLVYFCIVAIESKQLRYGVILGVIAGIGYFIKSSILLYVVPLFSLLILAILKAEKDKKKYLFQVLIMIFFIQIIVAPLYFQLFFWRTLPSNSRYIFTMSEIINLHWIPNIWPTIQLLFWYSSPIEFIFLIAGLFISTKKDYRIVGHIFIILILEFIIFTRFPSPRYIVSLLPLSVILVAITIDWIRQKNRDLGLICFFVILLFPTYFTILQIHSPTAYFSQLSKLTSYSGEWEYVKGWPAGYGVSDAISYIKSQDKKAYVGIRADAGNPEDAVIVYLLNSNYRVSYFDSKLIQNFDRYKCISANLPIYFVSRDNQLAGLDKFLVEKKRFYKPGSKNYVGVYKVKTDKCDEPSLKIQ